MLQKTGVKNIENNVYLFMIKFVGDKGCCFSSELFILFSLIKFQMAFKTFDPAPPSSTMCGKLTVG